MSLEMPSGASALFLFLVKDYNFDVVIKLTVILTHNVFSRFAIGQVCPLPSQNLVFFSNTGHSLLKF